MTTPRSTYKLFCLAQLALVCMLSSSYARAATTVNLDNTVVAPKSSMGVNVASASANIVNGGCFEAGPDGNGFASEGWGWFKGGGAFTASVDGTTFVSGKQSQKIAVTGAPVTMEQAAVDLPQASLTRELSPNGSYTIKAMIKSNVANSRVQIGIVDGGWAVHYSPEIKVSTTWTAYTFTYTPTATSIWRGVAIQYLDNANYWIDNLASWDANNIDVDTGFVKTYVDRLKEMKPTMLRLGGLGVNGMTLEHYLFKSWPLSYGPPPNEYLNINTFMTLCKAVGSSAFITVPPAFTDTATAATQTDLTVDIVNNHYADHGNIVDYLGGDGTTTYGARRNTEGFSRWDTQVPFIYYEMGNETWGTPDGVWDMHLGLPGDPWMATYATYCTKRMTDMKGRTGWRTNMRVGFGGFAADSDSWAGYSTTLIPAIKSLADFGTIFMYYGSGSNTNTDEQIYGGLFAKAQWHQRVIGAMNVTYATAAGHKLECCIYEGNCVWGNYFNGPSANDMFQYSHEVSAGAGVSLLDNYAAGNHAGVNFNNHFAFTGGPWSTLSNEPTYFRKPSFFALKIFNNYISGNLITATVSGAPTWNDTLTSEQNVPYVACYPYKNGSNYSILLVNRHRTAAQTITINRALTVKQLVTLTSSDINANNETAENVTMQVQSVSSNGNSYTVTVPPFSAYVVIATDPLTPPTVTLTAPLTNATFTAGSNITLTATAAATGGIVTKVEFYNGSTLLGTSTASPYTMAWNNVSVGQYSLTAKVTDSNAQSVTSNVVKITVTAPAVPPTVTLTSPTNGAFFTANSNIALTATAAATGATVSKVEFFNGSTLLGTVTASPYTFAWNNVSAGQYSLTAKVTDSNSLSTISSVVKISVTTPAGPPAVNLTSPADGASFNAGTNVTLTATAASSSGTISKVEFYSGADLISTATASPYSAVWNNVAAGTYVLTAKATDSNNLATVSLPSTISVTTVSTPGALSLTSGATAFPNPASQGQMITFNVGATGDNLTYTWDLSDGNHGSGASTQYAYGASGSYNVNVVISDGNGGSVSSSILVQVNDSVVGAGPDSDGDGFSDSFESAVGTDPAIATSSPTGSTITSANVQALTLSKASIKLNFAKANNDSIAFSGTLAVPAGFVANGSKVDFIAGGVIKTLTLNAKGSGVKGGDSIKVTLKTKKSVVLPSPSAKYSVNFKKGTFAATLSAAGLTNANLKAAVVTVPFTLIFNNVVYQKTQTLHYSAKAGKTGLAK